MKISLNIRIGEAKGVPRLYAAQRRHKTFLPLFLYFLSAFRSNFNFPLPLTTDSDSCSMTIIITSDNVTYAQKLRERTRNGSRCDVGKANNRNPLNIHRRKPAKAALRFSPRTQIDPAVYGRRTCHSRALSSNYFDKERCGITQPSYDF
jgi:hypothetical protein